ncbi:UBP-type zinc finger domain-containing protein [Hymenobacter sp. BRD67]|nr:UBP-type zinc finger domain-containing protein [Hymenobacter sp. BRD67]
MRADWIGLATPIHLETEPHSGCAHTGPAHVHPVLPSAKGCEECLANGDDWLHLRLCMECGHVGCCDSSKNKHATHHFHATGHPVTRRRCACASGTAPRPGPTSKLPSSAARLSVKLGCYSLRSGLPCHRIVKNLGSPHNK